MNKRFECCEEHSSFRAWGGNHITGTSKKKNVNRSTATHIINMIISCHLYFGSVFFSLCGFICDQVLSYAWIQLSQERRSLTHPEVIHELDRLLKLHRDVHRDVVVEAGTHGEALGERRPVVFPA